MEVLKRIRYLSSQTPVHMTLLDPDKQTPEQAARIARIAGHAGTDAIVVGGSSDLQRGEVNKTVRQVKAATDLPVILFPSGAEAVAPAADAIFFMSLLNSRSPQFLIREQKQATQFLRQAEIEPIPMGYLIVEPGMRAGAVGQADLIPRGDEVEAARYAMAAENFGMAIIFLEAGSGAPEPVPVSMVAAVREAVSILVSVGGGIRTPEQAAEIVAAGADIIVTGNIVEGRTDINGAVSPLVAAAKTRR